jgi:ribosomal-protein-alanine N-acetyltransferase
MRRAVVEDLARLMELERGCEGAPHWSHAVWEEILRGGGVERAVYVVEEIELLGFVVVSRVRDVAEVESMAVAVEQRRRGVARALCTEAMLWARKRGSATMELEVRAGNDAALRLYTGLEFVEQARRARYYRDPVEDAVLMRRALAEVAVDI